MTTDNMSNEEVIEVLKGIVFNGFDRTTRKERQALHIAIKALKERPQGDCISREALKRDIEAERHNLLVRGQIGAEHILVHHCLPIIDNAPSIGGNQNE